MPEFCFVKPEAPKVEVPDTEYPLYPLNRALAPSTIRDRRIRFNAISVFGASELYNQ